MTTMLTLRLEKVCEMCLLLICVQAAVMLTHALAPGVPSNIKTKVDNGYIHIQWDPPVQNAADVDYYKVHYKPKEHKGRFIKVNKNVTNASIAGVLCETTYTIFVRAYNAHHDGSQTIVQIVATGGIKPSAPRNVKGEVIENVDINVVWAEPEKNPGAVTEYTVYYKSLNPRNMTTNTVGVRFSNHTSYLHDLLEYTTYEICVTSKNQNYESIPSNIIRVMTSSTFETTVTVTRTSAPSTTQRKEEESTTMTMATMTTTTTQAEESTTINRKPSTAKKTFDGMNNSMSVLAGPQNWLLFCIVTIVTNYGMPETCRWG